MGNRVKRLSENSKRVAVDVEELVLSQLYTLNALINVLEKKGILKNDDVMEELKKMQSQLANEDGSVN